MHTYNNRHLTFDTAVNDSNSDHFETSMKNANAQVDFCLSLFFSTPRVNGDSQLAHDCPIKLYIMCLPKEEGICN